MNDFTKEELEDLLSFCYGGMYDDHPIEDYKLKLQIKIQSMIDNYPTPLPTCAEDKHDWEFVDHGSAGYYKCLICQRSYNEQTRLAE